MQEVIMTDRNPNCLGKKGESKVRTMIFDISFLKNEFGPGVVKLTVESPKSEKIYVPLTYLVDNKLIWTITEKDTFEEGFGRAQLTYSVQDRIVKTAIYRTVVGNSLPEAKLSLTPSTGDLVEIVTKQEQVITSLPVAMSTGVKFSKDSQKNELVISILKQDEQGTYSIPDTRVFSFTTPQKVSSGEEIAGLITYQESKKLADIEEGANRNLIESIKIGIQELPIQGKSIILPTASNAEKGLVVGSSNQNGISILEDGSMEVNEININKLTQDPSDVLVLEGNL